MTEARNIDGDLLLGLDVGGTFTDCAVVTRNGRLKVGKALTTPGNYMDGIIAAMAAALDAEDDGRATMLAEAAFIKHGTTVGTNAIIQRAGCRVGVITTAGFEDTLVIMLGHGRYVVLAPEQLIDFVDTDKPAPLVPRESILGVPERVDYMGKELVALDETAVAEAAQRLVAEGVDAIVILFLWSFLNPAHEERAAEIVRDIAPGAFLSLSSEVAPRLGEYERGSAALVNAYLGPLMSGYIGRFREAMRDHGHQKEPLIVQCAGGVVSARRAAEHPLGTIDSGPVAGLIGSSVLAAQMGIKNIVTTDMGGTSFDVGLITDGVPVKREMTLVSNYECFVPRIDVRAIGSGGGSIIWVDDQGRLNVGPQSAGSDPGPAFFGRGGTQPTLADANLLLGFLDPAYFFGGKLDVDRAAAERAIGVVAEQLGKSDILEVAAAVVIITEHKMADLIRKVTIEQGYDVRDFVTFAYGGSSALHAAAYSRALGIKRIVCPLGVTSSVWSAAGAAASNILRVVDHPLLMDSPLDMETIREELERLERDARRQLEDEGVPVSAIEVDRFALMRHKAQVYELPIPVDDAALNASSEQLIETFEHRYESLYGEGSAFPQGGVTVATLRVEGRGIVFDSVLSATEPPSDGAAATLPAREVYWPDQRQVVETAVFHGPSLRFGERVEGPCIVQSAETTIVVPRGDRLAVDEFGSYVLDLTTEAENESAISGEVYTGV
jgi:N-methylhydantoinase A